MLVKQVLVANRSHVLNEPQEVYIGQFLTIVELNFAKLQEVLVPSILQPFDDGSEISDVFRNLDQ